MIDLININDIKDNYDDEVIKKNDDIYFDKHLGGFFFERCVYYLNAKAWRE